MSELTPITRIESYLDAIVNSGTPPLEDITRIETFLQAIYDNQVCALTPITRIEMFLGKISGQDIVLPEPITRIELYLAAIAGEDVELPEEPITRIEMYLADWADSGDWTTISGAIVEFITQRAHKLKSCVVNLLPQQDLHGYDNPWPEGGGKNKFNIDDIYGVPVNTVDAERPFGARKDNDTLIWEQGLYSDAIFFKFTGVYLSVGTYTISADVLLPQKEDLSNNTISARLRSTTIPVITNTANATVPLGVKTRLSFNITIETSGLYDRLLIQPNGNAGAASELNCQVTNIQIESGSTATAFAPYSNICPISGWDGVTVYNDSKYGGLINWNQRFQGPVTATYEGLTVATSNAKQTVTIDGTFSGASTWYRQCDMAQSVVGHLYYIDKGADNTGFEFYNDSGGVSTYIGYRFDCSKATAAKNWYFRFPSNTGITYDNLVINPMCIDLTEALGEETADYISSMEKPDRIAYVQNLFHLPYYPYNNGEVTTVSELNGDPHWSVTATFGETVYGGTPDIVSGEMPVTYAEVDMGTLGWTKYDPANAFYAGLSGAKIDNTKILCKSSQYKSFTGGSIAGIFGSANSGVAISTYFGSNVPLVCYDATATEMTANEFKQHVSGVQLVYQIATPIETTITPTPVNALQGLNNVWSDAGDVTVTFRGTPIEEPDAEPLQALNLLLGGAYRNDQTPEDVPDDEALDILLGGGDR